MLQFDRMKLICPLDVVENVNERDFQTIVRDGQLTSYKYHQDTPFYLLIRKDFIHSECIIEFTGKILSDRYPELINLKNIRYCIEKINALGICEIDTERLLQSAKVAKCDVTRDVVSTEFENIKSQIKQSLSNYDKWEVEKYPNGICLRNKVTTDRCKKRICIYNKDKELKQQTNSLFLRSLHQPQRLLDYFHGKVRFELNIGTMVQVKRLLKIDDNSLIEVLNSTANPLLSVIDEALKKHIDSRQHTDFKDYVNSLILADNHNDLAELEAKIRALTPKGTVIKRKMQPYREYFNRQTDTSHQIDIRRLIS